MAGRPIKEGLDYYPHDTDCLHDEKIQGAIEIAGGMAYAVYHSLLESLYQRPDFRIDTRLPKYARFLPRIAAALHCRVPRLYVACRALADMELIDGKAYADGVIYAPAVEKRANAILAKRLRAREEYKAQPISDVGNSAEKTPEIIPEMPFHPRKEKRSEVKGIEGKGSEAKETPPPFSALSPETPTNHVLPHLVRTALMVASCPNNTQTVERYLKALLARGITAKRIEEFLHSPDCRGRSILEISDYLAPQGKVKPTGDEVLAAAAKELGW